MALSMPAVDADATQPPLKQGTPTRPTTSSGSGLEDPTAVHAVDAYAIGQREHADLRGAPPPRQPLALIWRPSGVTSVTTGREMPGWRARVGRLRAKLQSLQRVVAPAVSLPTLRDPPLVRVDPVAASRFLSLGSPTRSPQGRSSGDRGFGAAADSPESGDDSSDGEAAAAYDSSFSEDSRAAAGPPLLSPPHASPGRSGYAFSATRPPAQSPGRPANPLSVPVGSPAPVECGSTSPSRRTRSLLARSGSAISVLGDAGSPGGSAAASGHQKYEVGVAAHRVAQVAQAHGLSGGSALGAAVDGSVAPTAESSLRIRPVGSLTSTRRLYAGPQYVRCGTLPAVSLVGSNASTRVPEPAAILPSASDNVG